MEITPSLLVTSLFPQILKWVFEQSTICFKRDRLVSEMQARALYFTREHHHKWTEYYRLFITLCIMSRNKWSHISWTTGLESVFLILSLILIAKVFQWYHFWRNIVYFLLCMETSRQKWARNSLIRSGNPYTPLAAHDKSFPTIPHFKKSDFLPYFFMYDNKEEFGSYLMNRFWKFVHAVSEFFFILMARTF